MNEQEEFDERVRQAVNSLDDAPVSFRQAELWQQLQTELHTAPTRKKAVWWPYAAALVVGLAGVIWWQSQPEPASALAKAEDNKKAFTPKNQTKKTAPMPLSEMPKLSAALKTQRPIRKTKPSVENALGPMPVAKSSDFVIDTPTQINKEIPEEITQIVKNESVTPETQKMTAYVSPKAKPKFKIVHANELGNYQRAEVAVALEKETGNNGFIVVNWRKKTEQPSENTLLTWLKNKPSKSIQ